MMRKLSHFMAKSDNGAILMNLGAVFIMEVVSSLKFPTESHFVIGTSNRIIHILQSFKMCNE